MKTLAIKTLLTVFFIALQFTQPALCQNQITGKWMGKFMNDFKTIIDIHLEGEYTYKGTIQMYNGQTQIQNDVLSGVTLNDSHLVFYIEAKETEFKGEFNTTFTELKGEFIFPDKSKHPLVLLKSELNEENVKNNSKRPISEHKKETFSASELKEDFDFLINNLKKLHPKLYAFTSQEKINALIAKTYKNINTELTLNEYFKLISPVVECIKCSHTGIRLPDDYHEEISKRAVFLPIEILFEDEKAFFIKNNVNSTSMVSGDEVLTINNLPVKNIKKELYNFIPSEGMNSTTKNYNLNLNFNWLYHTINSTESFEIEYSRNGDIFADNIKACTFSEFSKNKKENIEKEPLTFVFESRKLAGTLTINSFMFPDVNKYIQEMDNIFASLKQNNAKHLVIDLRGNSGGHPIFAAQLFSYLIHKEFTYFKRNSEISEFEPLYNPMEPNKLQFNGNLYVLIDGGCLSTTGHLISLIKHHTNAVFIGEEPGSSHSCNDYSVELELPQTGIKVNIPRTTFETALTDFEKNYPNIVDYKTINSADDFVNKRDVSMEFANSLINKSNP